MKNDERPYCVKINGTIRLPEESKKNFDAEFAKFLDTLNASFDGEKQITPAEDDNTIPDIAISSLELSARTKNALRHHNIFTLKELSTYYKEEILTFRNIGKHSYEELAAVVETYGVHLISCMEETKELKGICSKPERAELCRKGISTIGDVYQLSDEEIVKLLGYRGSTSHKLFKLKETKAN